MTLCCYLKLFIKGSDQDLSRFQWTLRVRNRVLLVNTLLRVSTITLRVESSLHFGIQDCRRPSRVEKGVRTETRGKVRGRVLREVVRNGYVPGSTESLTRVRQGRQTFRGALSEGVRKFRVEWPLTLFGMDAL